MTYKEILLTYDFFIDNIYLEYYCKLIENNLKTTKISFKTQKHHFIPICYYKIKYNVAARKDALKYSETDDNNFCVNLLYKDHVLAHYYLSLCTTGKLKYQNENAVFHVLGNTNYVKDSNYAVELNMIKNLDKYQELYEDMAKTRSSLYKGRHHAPNSDDQKQKISDKNSGNIYVKKLIDGQWVVKKAKNISDFNVYLKEGWLKGNIKPKDLGNRISLGKKGKICINNGLVNKYICKDELPKFLAED